MLACRTFGELRIQICKVLLGVKKMPFVFCRLDYWLTSFHLFDNVKNVDIMPAIKTDHSAIIMELQSIDQQMKGPGSWKLNVSRERIMLKKWNSIYLYGEMS